MHLTVRVFVFRKWGMRTSGNVGCPVASNIQTWISRGAALARSRFTAAMSSLQLGINVQSSGVETMDSRQYRHTWVSGMIEKVVGSLLSRLSSWRQHRATRDRISGGNLLTGCSRFRKEFRSLRTSCALVSRLSIYEIYWSQTFIEMIWQGGRHYLWFQRSGGDHGGERCLSQPGAFQSELLIQHAEEVLDGKITSGFEGHGGGGEQRCDRQRVAIPGRSQLAEDQPDARGRGTPCLPR